MRQAPTRAVRSYVIYLRDSRDTIARTQEIEAGSDEEARQLAALMLGKQITYPSAEIWDRARFVCTVRKDPIAAA